MMRLNMRVNTLANQFIRDSVMGLVEIPRRVKMKSFTRKRVRIMANSKRQCCGCKRRFRVEAMIIKPVGSFCNEECMLEYAFNPPESNAKKVEKLRDKEHALMTRVFYATDLKTRKAAAKKWCHAYIKARDMGDACICCGRSMDHQYDSGHYLESGNNPKIRYDEDNIHSQSVHCNQYKGGNELEYRVNLIKKIGLARVERLESMKGGIVKRTCDDYKAIEDYYKDKIKQLEGE